ncbi:MAG: efflux RND transporter periplasmic adaptor subunit [Gluconacetobacter diazotrophicus]|nr:efflux RND transporter periplasmic adaptor subunit [Gluconacetobacter diazotrophicus]
MSESFDAGPMLRNRSRKGTGTRRRLLILVLLLLAVAAIPLWRMRPQHGARPAAGGQAAPVAVVSDTVLAEQDWQDRLQAFGQLRAQQGAELSAPVAGIVGEIDFSSGEEVKAGTVLLRLRLYDDEAKLQQLQALVSLWQANVARDQKQFQAQAISRATLDLDDANLRQFQAQVAAQAQVIEQKNVRAPFSGKLGIRQVDLGQYLPPGTVATSIQALDRLYCDFNVVQRDAASVRPGQAVRLTVDAWPDRSFPATVLAIDSRVDPQNRMAQVRATLDNRDRALLPGMFAVAHLDVGAPRRVVSVPQGAVSFSPYGDFVYELTPLPGHPGRYTAASRVVRLGQTQGDRVVVEDGVKPGDRIVTAGAFKLRDGAVVTVNNSVPVPDALHPAVREE